MSQVARTATAHVSSVSGSPRIPTSARPVAAFEPSAVEELSPKVGVSYEESEYLFQDFGENKGSDGQKRPPLGIPSLFRSSTEMFTWFIEMYGSGDDGQTRSSSARVSAFGTTLSKVIDTYETNARVGNGTMARRGHNFSFLL